MAFRVAGSDRGRSFERFLQPDRESGRSRQPAAIVGALQKLFRGRCWNGLQLEFRRRLGRYGLTEIYGASDGKCPVVYSFYGACVSLASDDIHTPGAEMINQILAKHDAGYKIELPDLVVLREQTSIAVEVLPPSLSDQAQNIIQQSLQQSQEYLTAGQYRQAVQEILWLLETVSTLFQGLTIGTDTIEGKYFNTIADELRTHQKGTTLERSLAWAKTLHGYLSSPTGGGVRHGANLRADFSMQENEARLFCNLIRSYISFLLAEHVRLTRSN
jgi:hypothetical protein